MRIEMGSKCPSHPTFPAHPPSQPPMMSTDATTTTTTPTSLIDGFEIDMEAPDQDCERIHSLRVLGVHKPGTFLQPMARSHGRAGLEAM